MSAGQFQTLMGGGGNKILFVNNLGTINSTSLTVTANAPTNSAVFLAVSIGPEATVPSSVTDSASNTYAKAISFTLGGARSTSIWYTTTGGSLSSGSSTISITGAGTQNLLSAVCFNGIKKTSPLDKTGTGDYNIGSTSPSSGASGTLTTPFQLILASLGAGFSGAVTTWTTDANFTRVGQLLNQGANWESSDFAYKIVNSTATISCVDTTNITAFGNGVTATFSSA